MPDPKPEILLVTPVWNDSKRLARFGDDLARELADRRMPVRWVIADDGSEVGEHRRLTNLRDAFAAVYPRVEVHFAGRHHGKGAVVREAWALDAGAGWLAFVDADGSVAAGDFLDLVATAVRAGSSVIGIRKKTEQTTVVESVWRGLAHRGFLTAVHVLLGLRCEDPQCGAKVLRGADYRHVAPVLRESGLAFDSELLAALDRNGCSWREVPVNWIEKKGGKVRPLRDGWGMLGALLRLRGRVRSGGLATDRTPGSTADG